VKFLLFRQIQNDCWQNYSFDRFASNRLSYWFWHDAFAMAQRGEPPRKIFSRKNGTRTKKKGIFVGEGLSFLATIALVMEYMRNSLIFSLLAISAIATHVDASAQTDSAHSLNVMSFNLRYNNPEDGVNAWPLRKELVANTLRFHHADLIGVQEALHGQLEDLSEMLPEFKWLGVGRDDGKTQGEYSAILYRHARFELLEQGNFWLSENPQQAGSVGWDAAITRIVTWAKFRDLHSGETFYHFNTHFDHMGQKAREESAKLLRARIAQIPTKFQVIVTGDFNAEETSAVYRTMTEERAAQGKTTQLRTLKNTRDISALPHHGPLWTFHGFGKAQPRTRIDYIFVSEGVRVLRHAAIYDFGEEHYPSDHLPVLAEVLLE